MANVLSTDKQIVIIGALCEGSSIPSIERTTGVHRDTIMRLGVRIGQGCTALLDAKMRNLDCHRLEMDEGWGFVGRKNVTCDRATMRLSETFGPTARLMPKLSSYRPFGLPVIAA